MLLHNTGSNYRLDPNTFGAAFHGMYAPWKSTLVFVPPNWLLFVSAVKCFQYSSDCKRSLRRGRQQAKQEAAENKKTKSDIVEEKHLKAMGMKVEDIIDAAQKEHDRKKTKDDKKRGRINPQKKPKPHTKEKATTKDKPALEIEELSSDEGYGYHSDESDGEPDVQERGHQTYQARSRQLAIKIAQHVSVCFVCFRSPACLIIYFKSAQNHRPMDQGKHKLALIRGHVHQL